MADRIAYINHDLDDAERAGLLEPGEEPQIVRERIGTRNSERINAIVTDVVRSSAKELRMSEGMADAVEEFTDFMYEYCTKPRRQGRRGQSREYPLQHMGILCQPAGQAAGGLPPDCCAGRA